LAVFLLTAASGCEFVNFEQPVDISPPSDPTPVDGGLPPGLQPLYPFRPGSVWQYDVTGVDGASLGSKYVAIDKVPVMVGGVGPHQLDMAYPVRTSGSLGGQAWLVTMQQKVGDQIVNWREETFDQQNQLTVDVNWEPQQLEVDQSTERTRTGASWVESYTEVIRPSGAVPTTLKQNETWTVVGQETLTLPKIMMPFQCIVFQKTAAPSTDAGTGTDDAGGAGDAGRTSDAGTGRPMLIAPSFGPAGDAGGDAGGGGNNAAKKLWYARGYGKVKEAGGGQPTEELSGLELH
jgi:hypothetical protein